MAATRGEDLSLVLNSAQGKYPIGRDVWVRSTIAAIESLAGSGVRLITSTGLNTWELAAWLAGRAGLPQLLIVAADDDRDGRRTFENIVSDFDLPPERVEPHFVGRGSPGKPKGAWRARDRAAVELADTIYPVSIRPGGKLELLLDSVDRGRIDESCRIDWGKGLFRPRYQIDGRTVNPEMLSLADRFLIHWTRSRAGAWPGEKPGEFYHDLVEHPDSYVRDAEATLVRIISESRLRASSWSMPEGEAAVALSALPPERVVPLMRWRNRYVRYSLEPFGLGIDREALRRMGAREVSYRRPSGSKAINPSDRLFVQSPGEAGDWAAEAEWRFRGDLSLKGIDPEDMIAIAYDPAAAERLRGEFGPGPQVKPLFV